MDYELLRLMWWGILGFFIVGFVILDGLDMGVAMALPFLGRNDIERRMIINTIGPIWESNQVWLILSGGILFAAWPILYSVLFSILYIPLFIVLASLIMRPVAFKFRSKLPSLTWRYFWDWSLFTSGLIPAFMLGVIIGNIFLGLPFSFDTDLRISSHGHDYNLFNPFALSCGVLSVLMMLTQGTAYLYTKIDWILAYKAQNIMRSCIFLTIFIFMGIFFWIYRDMDGYHVSNALSANLPSHPLHKNVIRLSQGWIYNYAMHPFLLMIPCLIFLGGFIAMILKTRFVLFGTSLMIVSVFGTFGICLYPFLLPSSYHLASSLTIWDASASFQTLKVMFIATVLFVPLILVYVRWAYRILRGRIISQDILMNENSY